MSEEKDTQTADLLKASPLPEKYANPAPLGLIGFGMTTFLLNLHNAGVWSEFDSMIMGMGIMFGGLAQLLAGILEFFKKNTFGTVAFTSYGCFWIALCLVHILPSAYGTSGASPLAMCFFLFAWGTFTLGLAIGTFSDAPLTMTQIIFVMLWILFWILCVENILKAAGAHHAATVTQIIAGIEGIVLGCCASYLSIAEVVNERYGRTLFPIAIPFRRLCPCCCKHTEDPDFADDKETEMEMETCSESEESANRRRDEGDDFDEYSSEEVGTDSMSSSTGEE